MTQLWRDDTIQHWRSGLRGEPREIRGVPATVRGGYRRRLVRVCMYCLDHDSGCGWHNGRLLPQHVLSHGICDLCVAQYHPFQARMRRLESVGAN